MKVISHTLALCFITSLVACIPGDPRRRDDKRHEVAQEPAARGGVNDGNTGELTTTKNNPWFVGKDAAHYCVEFGADTAAASDPAAQKSITDQVDAAFAQWVDLIQTFDRQSPGITKLPNGEFLAGTAVTYLTRTFQRVECSANPDMRIKVGTWDKPDGEFLKYTSRYTVSYALRTAYSEETGRSKGFVWLVADSGARRYKGPAPDGAFWGQGHYVQNVLLHELGHMIGVDHVPNTFMDANFPAGVLASKLSDVWSPDDFKALVGLTEERCGSFDRQPDNPDDACPSRIAGGAASQIPC
ncbi:MAG: hypothetical protein NTZ90_16790 [Proteobacteria bacterium]|nr:hypothetical protein [Pseudomonadota bacterium]